MNNTFKVCLLGSGGCGKSVFMKRVLNEDFNRTYIATLGVEVDAVRVRDGNADVILNVWDCAGQEKFGGLRDGYYIESQGAIFAFDLACEHSFRIMLNYVAMFKRKCGEVPFIVIGMKSDVRTISRERLLEVLGRAPYFEISSKEDEKSNIMAPINALKELLRAPTDV